jgi:hypothetical protein
MWKDILKKCSCEKDSNTEEVEKFLGGTVVAATLANGQVNPNHNIVSRTAYRGKKRKCKKCQK